MATEEAINFLKKVGYQKSAFSRYELFYEEGGDYKKAVDALEAALHAQQPSVKLDRNRWRGCEHCKWDSEGYTACFRDVNGRSRNIYIPEGEAAIVIPGKYNHQFYVPIKYCPFCGRPLTEEAWAEMEGRISP